MNKLNLNISPQNKIDFVANSVEMKEIFEVIQQVAPTDITILITGESGVGKEVVAKTIHQFSNRSQKPMLTVNCGAIPEGIIESELFGHERGAFTGASSERKGYFELADGGTIFLDEIGELPISTQVKFLRILENGEFMRVGSSTLRRVNVRIIAATNKNLSNEVKQNRFRTDLFYRLRSVNINIPPLRERSEDISILAKKFANDFAEKNKIAAPKIDTDALIELTNYYWPGNVRELRNIIESLLILSHGKTITADAINKQINSQQVVTDDRNLPVFVKGDVDDRSLIYRALLELKNDLTELKKLVASQIAKEKNIEALTLPISKQYIDDNDITIEEMEKKMIVNALQKYRGNRKLAASSLKISERTLYRKINEFGLA